MGKKCPQENSEILLLFETSKNDHCRCGRWGCKCPCSQFYVPFSQKSKMPFYSQNCHFSRIALLFSRSALLFPRSVFLFNVCLSNGFFPRWLYFLLVLLRAAQRDDNCLALKTSTWSMISYAFYSSFILHDSLENAISEDLEWLKSISWKHLEPFWMYLTLPFYYE